MKPRLLDLFCGAGGCAKGYQRAGFYVVGVDIKPQPNYCGDEFIQADALALVRDRLEGCWHESSRKSALPGMLNRCLGYFDAIHASPPCQAFTTLKVMHNAGEHTDLLTPIRALLEQTGLPYVIENVPGAPVVGHVTLCGTAFGLGAGEFELRRHRHFETTFPVMVPPCQHRKPTLGIYGDHARDRRRVEGENPERGRQMPAADGLRLAREAMEMPWANWRGLSQAVPPAYTEYLGHALMAEINARQAKAA